MKYGFTLKDNNGNDYRTFATSLTTAIKKTASEHDLNEDDIVSCKRGNSIGSISL